MKIRTASVVNPSALSLALLSTALLGACHKPADPAANAADAAAADSAAARSAAAAAATPATSASPGASGDTAAASTNPAAQLPHFHWRLAEASDGRGQNISALFAGKQPIQLDFANGRVNIDHLCNRMFGAYTLQGDTLGFGRLASTQMACADPALMAQERAASELFSGPFTLALSADATTPGMTLRRRDGTVLRFTGEQTAESRYGQGETVFLEIAAQTRPCAQPPGSGQQCLQAREIRFDEQGLRQGEPGPWQEFAEPIQGYQHQPGVRNVLRLKRYTRADAAAGTAPHLYVLDLVVESEQLR
ncbi:MAG TPA: META and DUF4377 domain-containing protein [Stenotrophomonas sp.]|nr:META and DUF4377 domain-containing protein [Stenotrophomonas sp.]